MLTRFVQDVPPYTVALFAYGTLLESEAPGDHPSDLKSRMSSGFRSDANVGMVEAVHRNNLMSVTDLPLPFIVLIPRTISALLFPSSSVVTPGRENGRS